MLRAIDTNVLLRLFVTETGDQNARLVGLIETDLFVPVTVILETEWVLRKMLRTDAAQIDALFRLLFSFTNVVIGDREAVVRAIEGRKRGLDFADALHQALSTRCASFLTFDRAFIRRASHEPDLPYVHEP